MTNLLTFGANCRCLDNGNLPSKSMLRRVFGHFVSQTGRGVHLRTLGEDGVHHLISAVAKLSCVFVCRWRLISISPLARVHGGRGTFYVHLMCCLNERSHPPSSPVRALLLLFGKRSLAFSCTFMLFPKLYRSTSVLTAVKINFTCF